MRDDSITELANPWGFSPDPLTDILRVGAQRLIEQAIEAELSGLLARLASETTPEGHARLARHGHLPEREVLTGGLSWFL